MSASVRLTDTATLWIAGHDWDDEATEQRAAELLAAEVGLWDADDCAALADALSADEPAWGVGILTRLEQAESTCIEQAMKLLGWKGRPSTGHGMSYDVVLK